MNECELQLESCRRQQPLEVASRGSCGISFIIHLLTISNSHTKQTTVTLYDRLVH